MDAKLDRLVRLMGSDQGFYVLALHSFVEWFLKYEKGYEEHYFHELTWRFRNELLDGSEGFIDGLTCLTGLARQHRFTNEVRHAFGEFDEEEARTATLLFVRFCALIGQENNPRVKTLAGNLSVWRNRISILEQTTHLKTLERMLRELQSRNEELVRQKEDRDRLRLELREARLTLGQLDLEMSRMKETVERKDARLDTLRRQRRYAADRLAELEASLSEYGDLEKYLRYLSRFSLYSRTRMEYERMVSQLTPEQEEVLASVDLSRHLLIKGGPGTGKSLVLIELIRRVLSQKELQFDGELTVLFITFTTTLARYNQYVSALRGLDLPVSIVRTIDSLFYSVFRTLFGREYVYDFDFYPGFFASIEMPDFLNARELESELENFLFGHMISRKEYIDGMIPRTGMRRSLNRRQREIVWSIRDRAAAVMETDRRVSKEYLRYRLAAYLRDHPEEKSVRTISYLFVDETQDLTAAAVTALNELSMRTMVFAGDFDQSLYCFQNPFTRAGLSFKGRTKILRTNFRNTVQIHRFAETFRRAGEDSETGENQPFPFRDGPAPEIFRAPTAAGLLSLLVGKLTIYLEELGYEPENVAVLAPSRELAETVLPQAFERAGIPLAPIRTGEFGGGESDGIRLGTLHSSKGLDFPVVLIYLPALERKQYYSEDQTEKLLRNLLYVGMTRAMDCLDLFVLDSLEIPGLTEAAGGE